MRLTGVLERGQMAARPAGGAARAGRNSGEAPGLSQKPRLPAQKVTLEPREFGRDSSRSGEEGSVSRISPSTRRAACPGPGRSKGTPTPDTRLWGVDSTTLHGVGGQAQRGEGVCVCLSVCVGAGGLVGWQVLLCGSGSRFCLSELLFLHPRKGRKPSALPWDQRTY